MPEIRTRKALEKRCPCTLPDGMPCKSSQIRYRKLVRNYKCDTCGNEFLEPLSDKKQE